MIAWIIAAQVLCAPITLEDVRAASKENLEALQAELDVLRAEVGVKASRAAIFPHLSMQAQAGGTVLSAQRGAPQIAPDGSVTYPDVPPLTRGNFQLGLSVSQLIYDGGRWWNQISASGAVAEAARGQLDEQRLASQFEAERRFFELLRSQQALEVLRATVDRSRQQLERARSLFEAGRGQKRDALDAEVNLGNDEIQVLRSQQAIVGAQVDLLSWLARPTGELEAVTPDVLRGPAAPGPAADAALALAREHRPLLKVLASQQRASKLSLEVAHSSYAPRVSANAGYIRSSSAAEPFFADLPRQNGLTFGLSMQWDIFSGFATQAEVSRASADLRSTELRQAQAERQLAAEIRRTSFALDSQLKIASLAEKNRVIAELALKLAEERFNAGAGSTLEVRDAQLKLTQTQLTQVQGRIDVEIARAGLARIVGSPL